jgi:DNA-binding transcriptional ArsR family regulator
MVRLQEHRHPLDPAYEEFARLFQSLANAKRLHVLRCLSEREKSVTEILACKAFNGVPQSTVSQHLGVLRNQGLVRSRRDGTNIYYRLSDERIGDLLRLTAGLVEKRAKEMQQLSLEQ